MNAIEEKFSRQLRELQLPCQKNAGKAFQLTSEQMNQLHFYYCNLLEWNRVMNLTTITEEEDVYTKHFLDSLSFIRELNGMPAITGRTLIDVGTGAGLPGLVLAIAFPQLRVTLMDSLNKRIQFLNDTAGRLKLTNVVTIHARAEELGRSVKHREQYDFAVSRAVANIATLSEYCIPFVKQGGKFVAFKAEKVEEELAVGKGAIPKLGGRILKQDHFALPETPYERNLLVIGKTHPTPKVYPRKAGTPSRDPLH